jgi:DNA (cytosine-5)-methyltransferase 1
MSPVIPGKPEETERRPWLLDLFCCAGGAAMGYYRAGFDVVGVDIAPQPNYPFEFVQADALEIVAMLVGGGSLAFDTGPDEFHIVGIDELAAIHASPPCQGYSDLAHRTGGAYPMLVGETREALQATGLPYVIENVEGAPLVDPVMLCGTMFHGLRVLRHRLFESNVPLTAPPHGRHPLVFTHDKRKAHYGRLNQNTSFVQVTGGGNATVANKLDAMGIDWMTGREVNEAIPPAYTEHIGRQLLAHLVDAPTFALAASDPTGETA